MTAGAYLRSIAWVRLVHLVFGFAGAGLAGAAWTPALASLLPLGIASALASIASVPVVRALQGKGDGDGMFEDGRRVDSNAWMVLSGIESAETAALLLPLAAGAFVPIATWDFGLLTAGLFIGLIGLAWVRMLLGARWTLFQSLRANHALFTGDPARALRLTTAVIHSSWINADQKRIARALNADARLQTGDRAGARAALEEMWSGTLDLHALPLALDRLARDDARLAQQVIAAAEPRNLLDRRGLACLRGYVAVLAGAWDPAIDAELAGIVSEVPPRFADMPLRITAAGRQLAGDGDGAREAIAQLSNADHTRPWFAEASPRLARLLHDAMHHQRSAMAAPVVQLEPTVSAPPPPAGDPFAPPKGTVIAKGRLPALRGAVPLEFAGLALRTRSILPLPRELLLAIRVASTLMLLPLLGVVLALIAINGTLLDGVGLIGPVLGVAALILALTTSSVAPLIELLAPSVGPRIVLDDGGAVTARWWTAYRWADLGGGALLGLAVGASGFAIAGTIDVTVHPAWFTVPLGLLLGVSGATRARVQVAAAQVLFGDPRAEALRLDARVGTNATLRPALAVWRGAAWLRAGEPARAAEAWRAAQPGVPRVGDLLAWLDVTRGAVDVDRTLDAQPAEGLGPALRLAIGQGLVAARDGLGPRVAPRLAGWTQLAWTVRNPFGDLLALVIAAVRLPEGSDPWEGLPPVDRAGLDWAITAWPFLAAARDAESAAAR